MAVPVDYRLRFSDPVTALTARRVRHCACSKSYHQLTSGCKNSWNTRKLAENTFVILAGGLIDSNYGGTA
jgi:hypothetical protein